MPKSVKPQNSRQAIELLEHHVGHDLEPETALVEMAASTVAGAVDFDQLVQHIKSVNLRRLLNSQNSNLEFIRKGRLHPEQIHQRFEPHRSAWLLVTRFGTDAQLLREWLHALETRLARSVTLFRATDVIAAFSEMIDNALEHGRSEEPHVLTFEIGDRWWLFSVTDRGVGVPATIRSVSRYAKLSDFETVCEALKEGVSCTQEPGRGGGFRQLIRVLIDSNCALHMRTGCVSVHLHGNAALQRLDQTIFSVVRRGLHLRARGILA